MAENKLYYGDNLDILYRYVSDESVDLIYLDPPFKSSQDYNILFREQNGTRSAAQIKAFEDTWRWDQKASESYQEMVEEGGRVSQALQAFRQFLGTNDMLAYLSMMAPRLVHLRRVLKPTGSIYLHCDPTASHYLKMLMDAVFRPENFRNEIIWHYGGRGAKAVARQFARNHDIILFYSRKRGAHPFARRYVRRLFTPEEARRRGFRQDEQGRWFKTAPRGDYTDESIRALDAQGRVYKTVKGNIRIKYFLEFDGGMVCEEALVGDVWDDIPDAMHIGKERLGYPTQKPQALLQRIIQASSDEEEVVLDPFCGCGAAIAAAQKLGRRWIGIDITHLAISLIRHRLADSFGEAVEYDVIGEPVSVADATALARQDPFQFQCWALGLVHARPTEQKKGSDRGIDGRLYFHDDESGKTKQIIFSVKSGQVNVAQVRDLRGVVERERAQIGVLITLEEPTRAMRTEAAASGFYDSEGWGKRYARVQILTVRELLDKGKVEYPPSRRNVTFKKAPRIDRADRVREAAYRQTGLYVAEPSDEEFDLTDA